MCIRDRPDTLREDKVISSCSLTLYDQNNQKITDYSGMYLSMSTETVEITIPVMPKKTVPVVANTINGPKNFPAGRIPVEPQQIDIAAPTEVLSADVYKRQAMNSSKPFPCFPKALKLKRK